MVLSIITLNFNKYHLTLSCLKSLYQYYQNEFETGVVELIIVDNASGDESVEKIKKEIKEKKYKNVLLVANPENSGFGKGCNIGVKEARGKYLLFLNNDTLVKDKSLLAMVDFMHEDEKVSILGGQLTNPNGTKQNSAGDYYTLGKAALLLLGMQKYGLVDKNPTEVTTVDWVKGGLMMVRKDIFAKLHGFDEKIFMYTEDMELCYRAEKSGYKTYFFPHVTVMHEEHGSGNKSFAIVNIYKNLLYFYKKHRSFFEYFILKCMLVIKAIVLIVVGTFLSKKNLTETYKKAFAAVW